MLEYYFVIASLILALLSFTYYMINSYPLLTLKKEKTKSKPSKKIDTKEVTILIPVYNEDVGLFKKCIAIASKQGCKFIVIGDSSNEPYKSITINNGGKFIFHSQRKGKRKSISEGASFVNTKYILLMDSDMLIPSYAVKHMLSKFDEDVGAVGATISMILVNNWVSYCSEFFQKAKQAVARAMSTSGNVFLISGGCGMYRTKLLKPLLLSKEFYASKILGKKNATADDQQITDHILRSGYKAVIDYDVDACMKAQDNFKQFFYQTVRWTRGGYLYFFKEVLDGSYIKKGALYSFETFYIYLLPIVLVIMALLRLDLIFSYNLIGALSTGISGLSNIIFLNYQNLGSGFAYLPFVTATISVIGTGTFLLALTRSFPKKKLKTLALGAITSAILFCASIYALLTLWDESWYTR